MQDESRDLAAIERHIAAVAAVHKVVRAIWSLSRAQLPLVEAAVEQATKYFDWIDEMVAAMAGAPRRAPERELLLVVMGPERAYCGGMPRQILEQLADEGRDGRASEGGRRVGLVGTRLAEMAAWEPQLAPHVVFALAGATTHEDHEEVARAVAEAILEHAGTADVELRHPREGGSELHRVTLLSGAREPLAYPPETFSPVPTVIDAAVAEGITGRLAVGAAEALRSEVRARIAAADAARRAADEKLEVLKKDWAHARQAQITGELCETIAGRQAAMALLRRRATKPRTSGRAPGERRGAMA